CCIPFISLLIFYLSFFFNDTATTDIYTLSLHDALPICQAENNRGDGSLHPHAVHYSTTCVTTPEPTVLPPSRMAKWPPGSSATRSEEHTSELQSRSDLVCRLLLEKKKKKKDQKEKKCI